MNLMLEDVPQIFYGIHIYKVPGHINTLILLTLNHVTEISLALHGAPY